MGKETNWRRGCNDNYRQQSPYRWSGTLFLGNVYSSARETVNTLFQSSPDVIVTTGDTMDSLMRSKRNCSLLIKSHSSHYTRAQWLSPGCWLSSYSPGAIIAAAATPSRHPQPLPPDFIQALGAKGRGFIIAEIFLHASVFLFSCHHPPPPPHNCFTLLFSPFFYFATYCMTAGILASLDAIDRIDKWIF